MAMIGAGFQENAASNECFRPPHRASPNPGQVSFLRTYPRHRRRRPAVWAGHRYAVVSAFAAARLRALSYSGVTGRNRKGRRQAVLSRKRRRPMTTTFSHTDLQRLTLPELYGRQQQLRRLLTDLPMHPRERDAISASLERVSREISRRARAVMPMPP